MGENQYYISITKKDVIKMLKNVPFRSQNAKHVKKSILIAGLLCGFLGANAALADLGDQYALAKIGAMAINKNDADPVLALGGIYGIGLSPSFTFEAEFSISLGQGGEYVDEENGDEGQYDIWTIAGYVAYRYPFNDTVYLKLKGGIVYEDVERSGLKSNSRSTGVGAAGGGGLGFVLDFGHPVMLELEATATEKDIIFYSLGMTYPF